MKILAILLITLALASSRSYPLFKQCNSAWGSDILGSGPATICKAGCVITSVSMALSSYGKSVGGAANPKTLNAWLKTHSGFSGQSFVWGSISSLGFKFQGKVSASSAQTALDQGKVVILNVRGGGHWVLATGRNGNTFLVNDPGYNVSSYSTGDVTQAAVFTVSSSFLQSAYESINNFFSGEQINDDDFETENNYNFDYDYEFNSENNEDN